MRVHARGRVKKILLSGIFSGRSSYTTHTPSTHVHLRGRYVVPLPEPLEDACILKPAFRV